MFSHRQEDDFFPLCFALWEKWLKIWSSGRAEVASVVKGLHGYSCLSFEQRWMISVWGSDRWSTWNVFDFRLMNEGVTSLHLMSGPDLDPYGLWVVLKWKTTWFVTEQAQYSHSIKDEIQKKDSKVHMNTINNWGTAHGHYRCVLPEKALTKS